jgi:hypothetical protein
MISSI